MKRYDTYKNSGIEWIGEIPEHWDSIRLKYIGNLYGGLSGKSSADFKQDNNPNNKPFIPFTNIANNKVIDPNHLQYVVIKENEKQNQVTKGDLFFMMSSENIDDVGKSTVLLDDLGETYLNSFCKGFHFTDKNYSSRFINYLLLSKAYRSLVQIEANGFTRINLKIDKINDIPLKFPLRKEQTAIANFLDKKTTEIDQLITQKETLLKLYEEEKRGIINQAVTKGINPKVKLKDSGVDWLGEIPVGWEVKRFKYFFNLMTQKSDKKLKKIGLENIISKTGKFIDTNSDFEGQGVHFKKKDVLFGKLRPYLAKVWLANFEGHAVGDFYIFRTTSGVIPEFAKYRILDYSFIDVTNSSTYGSRMPRVSWEFIANLFIAFPNLNEQTQIVNHIETETAKITTKVNNTKKLIALLKEYKTALISEVVTGKIKVN